VKKMSDKGTKPASAKPAKKKSSANLQIILAAVGLVVLAGVGITLYFLFRGDDNKPAAQQPRANQPGAGQAAVNAAGEGAPAAGPDLSATITKVNELTDKLTDAAQKDDAARQLRDILESDVVMKAPNGRMQVLNAIKDKALTGNNDAAKEFIRDLAKDKKDQSLAAAAQKVYDENLVKPGEEAIGEADSAIEPTNLLPNKVDVVFRLQPRKLIDSDYNKGLFASGAYRKADFDHRLGMDSQTVDQIVIGGMKDHGQAVGIIRTGTAFNWDEVRRALEIEPNGTNIKGKTYYLGKIDLLTEFLGKRIPGIESLRGRAAFWRADPRTLVYGDEQTVKGLLENPPERQTPLPPPSAEGPEASNTPPPVEEGAPMAGGGAGRPNPGAGGAPPARMSPLQVGAAGTGGTGNAPQPQQPAQAQAPTQEAKEKEKPDASRFLTIDRELRRLITHVEDPKNDSLVLFADKVTTKVPVLTDYVYYLNRLPSARGKDVEMLVMVLPQVQNNPTLRLGLKCKSRRETPAIANEVEKILARVGKEEMRDMFGFEFHIGTGADQFVSSASGGQQGFPTGGGMDPGGPAGAGGRGGTGLQKGGAAFQRPTGAAGGQQGPPPPGRPGNNAPPDDAVSVGPGGAGGNRPPGFGGGNPANPTPSESTEADTPGRFGIERLDEYILITASVRSSITDFTEKQVGSLMAQLRGSQEMASGKRRFGDLAAGLDEYKQDLTKQNKPLVFPYGAYPRPYDAERGSRPWPANQRVSFLREMLPYLGDDRYFTLKDSFALEKSWRDPDNLAIGRILVPYFLNPSAGNYYVKEKDINEPLAATHFVGMAGVGPDAAYLPKSDPRAGIFGYNRQTSLEDIKDGLSNTIFMIEADKALVGPWIAGGGATVRGTSNAGNDVGRPGGFSSPDFGGKKGVWVLMADGSARYLTKDISPDVFKALCTMAGSDSTGAIDLVAPKQNLEVSPRSTQQAQAAPKKRVVEEEETPKKKQ
jgi:hypothetical protein